MAMPQQKSQVGHLEAVSHQSRTGMMMSLPHPWLATAYGVQVVKLLTTQEHILVHTNFAYTHALANIACRPNNESIMCKTKTVRSHTREH